MSDFLRAARYTDLKNPEPHQVAAWNWAWGRLTAEEKAEFLEMFRAAPAPKPAPNAYQALADLLALIRSGEGSYNSINRGRAGDTPGGWTGLTAMSVAEVMDAQAKGRAFAVGAYQFIPATLREAVARTSLPVSLKFSEEVQDWLAMELILGGRKRPTLTSYLRGKSVDLDAAQLDLAREWASVPGPDGKGVYDGDSGGNKAHLNHQKVRAALAASRTALAGRGIEALPKPEAPKQAAPRVSPSSPFSTKLTPHFTLGEFALGQEARRFHHQHQVDTAIRLAQFMEKVRAQFGGKPIKITSGYRPPAINKAVGGASSSEHLYNAPGVGAVDFYVQGADINAVERWIDGQWPHSLGYGAKKGFHHVGIRAGAPRVRWDY